MNVCVCNPPHKGNNASIQHVTKKTKQKCKALRVRVKQSGWLLSSYLRCFYGFCLLFFFALEVGHCAAPWKLFKMMRRERAANMVFRGAFWVYRQWEQGKKRKKKTVAENHSGGFRLLVWSLFLAKRSAGSPEIREQVSAALMEVFQELRWILLHRVLTAAC